MIDPISYDSNLQEKKGNKKTVIVIIVIIVAIIIGGFFYLQQSKKTDQTKETTEITTEIKKPSPTEKPEIDRKSIKIQVLNGTGTPGQAGTVVDDLKSAGYDSDNIKTANAEEYDKTITTISIKKGFDYVADDIKDVLKSDFDEIRIDSTELDTDSEFDVVITTGGKIFEEVTPTVAPKEDSTPSPTPTETDTTPTPTP